ncbi:hypothetical protein ACH5RR_040875 [Cinchona calisaya]|uniref:Uncharacterized protein n=1 Tax=Cinchona calisaya TaxID=153742 RepID=A0ABD2XTI6_9GENT
MATAQSISPINVGIILDTLSGEGEMSCIRMAFKDFYLSHSHYKTRLVPYYRDAKEVVGAAAAGAIPSLSVYMITCVKFLLSLGIFTVIEKQKFMYLRKA